MNYEIPDLREKYAALQAENEALRKDGFACAVEAIKLQHDELVALRKDAERLDWYEEQHTLHSSLDLLYVVDGYDLEKLCNDGLVLMWKSHGANLRAAIDAARQGEKPATNDTFSDGPGYS